MLNIFSALYDFFVNFMVTDVAYFSVTALVLTAIVHCIFLKEV